MSLRYTARRLIACQILKNNLKGLCNYSFNWIFFSGIRKIFREYNGLRQQLLVSEKQLTAAKAQVDVLQLSIQTLTNEKTKLTSSVDELRTKIGNLELNNTVLRETSKMQDEQLEDYEKFVGEQTVQVQSLMQEKCVFFCVSS